MKIVVTSQSFSNNKRLTKELYKYFSNVKLNKDCIRFSKNELIEFIKNADALIVGLDVIDNDVLQKCHNLKFISKYGVGLNNLNLNACKERNINIGWSGGVNRLSVAEMTLGFMLMLSRNLFISANDLKNGIWKKKGGSQLTGKSIGIIGVGNIGKELVNLLRPFLCNILVNDIIDQSIFYKENNLTELPKVEIFRNADIVTIHTPLDETTVNMVDLNILKKMKPSSYIINSARGGIVNENDLKIALKQGIISGAALDVYDTEPPIDKELLNLPNLICTPHIGGNAKEAIEAMGLSAIKHIKEFFYK